MSHEAKKIADALSFAYRYGQIDGEHHKTWVIDQMVRALLGEPTESGPFDTPTTYAQFVRRHNDGEDGPDTYAWDEGIAP